jgi:hypothetical protein
MFAALNSFLTRLGRITDPYWANVSMLLHGDGVNGGQNNTFLDGSTNNFTVTRNGNTTQGSFNPFVSTYPYAVATNGGSAYFDGTGDYLTVPDSTAFTLGTNDFTIECWIYSALSGFNGIAGQIDSAGTITSGSFIMYTNGTALVCNVESGSTTYAVPATLVANAWNHVAFVRNGTTLRAYVGGVQGGTFAISTFVINDSTYPVTVGRTGDLGIIFNGYISNFRLVNGTCLYPSGTTFTPSTTPLTAVTNTALLLGMSNAAIFDNAILNNLETVASAQISTSVFKYGTGSMSFNGTTDYLPTPAKTAFNLGTGDFTVEMWVYPTGSTKYIAGQCNSGRSAATTSIFLYSNFQDTIELNCGVGGIFVTANSFPTTAPLNAWTHIAGVRDGATIRVYINGVQAGTASISTSAINTSTNNFSVGRAGEYATTPFPGYIDDFRFTKGICRYPSGTTFTPPTAAFPNSGP